MRKAVNLMDEVWKELKAKGELAQCRVCGKNIWKLWKAGSTIVNGGMDTCGPCLAEEEK